jgi:hypothetical protein
LTQHNGAIDIAFPREGIAHPAIETRKKKFKLSSDASGGDVVLSDEPEPSSSLTLPDRPFRLQTRGRKTLRISGVRGPHPA